MNGKEALTVAAAIKRARGTSSIRRLANESGVSAGQISRIEAGEVARPSLETLMAISRGLNSNPLPILVLSGHVDEAEARRQLAELFGDASEIEDEWGAEETQRARNVLADPASSFEEVRRIASDLFAGEPLYETTWDESHLLMASAAGSASLRTLAQLWSQLTPERQDKALDFLRDQAQLSRQETSADAAHAVATWTSEEN
jgi:transcriptional regulator with XRE-family HTH domain